ncbi:LysR family transcriptional regulator [Paraburkholderia susongensis]|uniref:Transcriptional regulator, LysR family n=1 Tax=Paraburkholderia susongensis TaxID=1515439 RepID=A0A1X7L7B1_9BURK|nr:LysR family transcriptional regulator [Paraburkholderia susongensis]SMG49741.1 transcriptional regulator, LysR family [Paraburkholderia susongensis]
MDSVENVRAFLAVVEVGSFAGAALRLGLAGSVVTKRVSALEKELNMLLFQRTTRSLHLTSSGRETIAAARSFLASYERLMSAPVDDGPALSGRLRIKAPSSFTNHFLGKLLNDFFRAHPKVDIELQLTNRPVDPLLEGFDFVITGLPVAYDGVEEFPLCPFRRLVYAAPSYLERYGEPSHPSELRAHQCLLYSYLSPVRNWTFSERGSGGIDVTVNGAFSTNDIDAMHRATVDGLGIAVLPRYRAKACVQQGQLVQILKGFDLPDFWIKVLRPADHNNPKLFRALLDFLTQGLTDLAKEDDFL